jgi:PAS domain S-box-containing protein
VDDLGQALAAAAAERDLAMAGLAASERRFRALAAAGALVVWRSDASGAILEGEGWTELTGQPAAALRGNGCMEKLHPDDRAGALAAQAAARAAGKPVDVEYRIRTVSGEWRWVRSRGVPVASQAGGAPAEWVGVVEDVEHRRLAERALAERETRLRLAVEAARFTTWDYDIERGLGSRIGRPGEDFVTPPASGFGLEGWSDPMHPEDRAAAIGALRAAIAGDAPHYAAEFRVRRRPPAEGWAWIASYGAVTERDPVTGAARRIGGVAQDITARREAEARRILLAREVDHRAKNVLAVVQSVLRLAPRDQPAEFAAAVERRVAALARVHTLLAEEGWAGAEFRTIAERELAGFPSGAIRLEGAAVAIGSAAVQPLAMVLHELATNAVKHGALARPEGRVTLRWGLGAAQAVPGTQPSPDGQGPDGDAGQDGVVLWLDWTETGGPPLAGTPGRRGFGSRVIEATVRGQLGGSLAYRWEATGLQLHIAIPAARVLACRAMAAEEAAARGVGLPAEAEAAKP